MNDTSGRLFSNSSSDTDPEPSSESKSPPRTQLGDRLPTNRVCKKCKTERMSSEFYRNSKGAIQAVCKECRRHEECARKQSDPKKKAREFKRWRRENRGHALVAVARNRAKKRGWAFDLDPMDIQGRINAGQCEVTGIRFNLDEPRAWNSPSLDRTDSDGGYTTDNVRVVLYALNVAANSWGLGPVMKIASAVQERRQQRSQELSDAIAERLMENLPCGSIEYRQTWKRKVTPSGSRYLEHTASAPRTGGSGCSGWPTATRQDAANARNATAKRSDPNSKHNSGTTALAAATVSPWQSPTVGNATGGNISRSGDRSNELLLNGQAKAVVGWATPNTMDHLSSSNLEARKKNGGCSNLKDQVAAWSTPNTGGRGNETMDRKRPGSGSPDLQTTASCVALNPPKTEEPSSDGAALRLNPRFSLWLMGYPTAWASCGERVTPSSRRSRQSS